MTHTDLIARLRVKDRPLMQQGNFSSIRLAIREAADALTAQQKRIEELEGLLRDVIEMWDWCNEDPYDRGYGPVSDAMHDARAALAGNQDEPA